MARTNKPTKQTAVAEGVKQVVRSRTNKPTKEQIAFEGAVKQVIQARYDAAGNGRRMSGWSTPPSGPNRATQGQEKVRDRSRDLVRNDWTGESAIQKWSTNLIGIGIRPRLKRRFTDKMSDERRQELGDLWDDFVNECDADGVLSFYGMQTLAVRAWLADGEVFIRKRPRRASSPLTVPLQVQLVESDFVPIFDADTYTGLPKGNKIRSGIELDNRGQRTAIWMYREHPGDGRIAISTSTQLIRVPITEVMHMFKPLRPGQLRGVSLLAPIIPKVRDIGNYQDAVLLRQQLANLFVAFLTRKVPGDNDELADPISGLPLGGSIDEPLTPLAPGLFQELEDGQDVKFSNPPEAGTTYSDYLRTELLGVAANSGLPYELFSGDIREVSDRTLRVLMNEFRRLAEQNQWQIVIPMLCQPVRTWWTETAALAGEITADEVNAVKRVEWSPQGWAYIHPVQDVQGQTMAIEAGITSRSSVINSRGDDAHEIDEERAADKEREDKLGLTPIVPAPGGGGGPVDPNQQEQDGIDNEEYTAPPNPKKGGDVKKALLDRAAAETDALKAKAESLRRPAPAPQLSLFEQSTLDLTQRIVTLLEEPGDEQ